MNQMTPTHGSATRYTARYCTKGISQAKASFLHTWCLVALSNCNTTMSVTLITKVVSPTLGVRILMGRQRTGHQASTLHSFYDSVPARLDIYLYP